MDYSNLNDTYLEDTFPLPRIDQIVDVTTGHNLLSFLNEYSSYNHIPMFPLDSERNAFITPMGMYCYNVTLFGLKNAGATYQPMMSRMFETLLGKTMEVYIYDKLVKLESCINHLTHLQEAFLLMRQYCLRLNPNKCIFGVESRKFLGFFVSKHGIEVAPVQAQAIMKMQYLITRKQI